MAIEYLEQEIKVGIEPMDCMVSDDIKEERDQVLTLIHLLTQYERALSAQADAMQYRSRGQIGAATVVEGIVDRFHASLPGNLKW